MPRSFCVDACPACHVTGEVYNIGTDRERTVLDVARAVAAYFKVDESKIVRVKDRAFNDRCAPASACYFMLIP